MKKYSREVYDLMLTAKHQQTYDLQKKVRLIKSKKTPESSRALEAKLAVLEVTTENSRDERLFADVQKPKANNRSNPALDRRGSGLR